MAKSAPISNLHAAVAAIFGETQVSAANHRKNSVALYKVHVQASKPSKDGSETREEEFEREFMLMLTRVMELKKGALPDRVVRFAGTYVKHLNTKVAEENEKKGITPDDTLASRFTSHILNFLMGGFNAKNKVVRGRCVQIVAEMMPGIGDLDEDTFNQLRFGLSQRIRDKETSIRVSAVVAIHKLIGTEDPDDDADEETVLERLLDIMSNDDAAEVRRAVVQYIPILQDTLHHILLRLRDVDAQTRKTVYSAVLQPKLGHPRRLTIAQREEIVKSGLGDREPSVRLAASKMLASWLDIMMGESAHAKELEAWEGDDGGIMKGLVEFLHLFDVVGPGSVMGADGVTAIFNLRPDIVDIFKFTDEYWTSLTAESAVLARCFVAFCLKEKKQEVMDESGLPAISAFAYHIGDHYNSLLAILDELRILGAGEEGADSEEIEQREEDLARAESILKELLQMTVNLDFSDELGRRKLFAIVRNILGHIGLREVIIEPALDVLYQITPSEQELVRIVVEIVSDLRDKDEDEDEDGDAKSDAGSVASVDQPKGVLRKIKDRSTMSPEEQRAADEADLRCLTICIAMLERVNGSFEENVILEGLIADLIVPAVKSKDIVMREKGLISLGLCCLIAKKMALNSFKLFFSQLQNTPDELRLKVLTIVFDLILVYEFDIIARDEVVAEQITTFLVQMLEAEEVPKVQATLCVGICKLLLAGLIKDQKVLATLVLTYISPVTAGNEELRQCLSFFFPVYCYSSLENQARMQAIFLQAFEHATELRDELEEGEDMITLQQLSTLMMDWTNQEKSVDKTHDKKQVHASLAVDLLKALYDSERTDEERKIFCQQLNHLHINKGLDLKSITKLNILTENLHAQHPLQNATLERSMNKFRGTLGKMFEHDLQELEFNTLLDDEIRGLYDYIGVDVPEGEDVSFSFERSRFLTDSMVAPAQNEDEDEYVFCSDYCCILTLIL
ncbi:hypothetical protein CYLTODRAFT_19435 [Cylindrobasidium torrendii FP15055 ss-10]|uniref:Nuclear condensin complex subunit 3 C-terminal domain-containing protein n=1 Tax=Cylindrobasidium torrendii FP15055 ss-10 TaxID=1314674 RepID=A0A0D7BR46_9AGAR|nr:hypothetical protein CYLTODRAFT_19435 [Cylindrobasidium torrendii FP15055 ss-10]